MRMKSYAMKSVMINENKFMMSRICVSQGVNILICMTFKNIIIRLCLNKNCFLLIFFCTMLAQPLWLVIEC